MVRGRDKGEWGKLSVICATLYNASGWAKKMVSPDEFNPYVAAGADGGVGSGADARKRSIPLKAFAKYICKCAVCGRFGLKCVCEKGRSDG